MMTVARKPDQDADPFAGLKTEWNREAKFVAKDGTVDFTMQLPPHCPDEIAANGKRYRAEGKDDPMIFHEVTD